MSRTGTPTLSSARMARPASPPGWSRPRSTGSSTPARWSTSTPHGTACRYPALARWLLVLGIVATLAANVAQGWSHGPVGAVVAAWPAVSLVGSYELLAWIIRTAAAGEPARVPAADHERQQPDQPWTGPCPVADQLPDAGRGTGRASHPSRASNGGRAGVPGPSGPVARTRSSGPCGPGGGPGPRDDPRSQCTAGEARHCRRGGRLPQPASGRVSDVRAQAREMFGTPPGAGHAAGWPKPGRIRRASLSTER